MTSRGLALPAVLAGTWLAKQAEAASLPASLTCSTIEAAKLCAAGGLQAAGLASGQAIALAKGVVRAMFLKKLRMTIAFLLVVVTLAGAGAGLTGRRATAQQPGEQAKPTQVADSDDQSSAAAPPPAPDAPDASETVTHRTANFEVTAPTREAARKVALAAERHRKALALLWLAEEMPTWEKRCPVRVRLTDQGGNGYSTFQFDNQTVILRNMELGGKLDEILANVLPHEITHAVLRTGRAGRCRAGPTRVRPFRPRARNPMARHAQAVLIVLDEKRELPLRTLLSLREYPRDVMALFAQSFSLTDFLVSKGGRAKFLKFVKQGDGDNWARAAKAHYGYATLDDLERAWIVHARKTPRSPAKMVEGPASWSSLARNDQKPEGKLPDGRHRFKPSSRSRAVN